ncbi:hypothetical protein [Klebsiella pneumoniae]|uniref:hypothetical protein n=1 Tax=Klebsiella pneumoniae TaxID=573 RepID=UPI001F4AA980|nr:hypothetical protein [Klebsiella pneumoniae]
MIVFFLSLLLLRYSSFFSFFCYVLAASRVSHLSLPRPGQLVIRASLTSITESDAQISGGETRQAYKDTRRFPLMAPSCSLLFLPFGLPVSFRCYGRVCLIPRLTPSSG